MPRLLWKGFFILTARGSRGWEQGVTYSARSSVHSTSGPALMGLVHFCCMGLSSSAAQHSSSVSVRKQKLEDTRKEETKSKEQRSYVLGMGEGTACTYGKGNGILTSQLTSQVRCFKLP